MTDRPSIVSHLVAAVWVVLAVLLLFLAYQAVTGDYTL
jgi:thiosulfate reductase cytochrome b subunit